MPLRRTLLLGLYLLELFLLIPLRFCRCIHRGRWSSEHAEACAIEEYMKFQQTTPTTIERHRLQDIFNMHPEHRDALRTVLPELWRWYPMGRLVYPMGIITRLKNKLALLDYHHQRPAHNKTTTTEQQPVVDLLDVTLPPTIWIVGLPRTGSTYFHSVFALDEKKVHTYKQWELRNPVPSRAGRESPSSKDHRQKKAEGMEWLFSWFFSPLKNIHYVLPTQVDECVQGFVEGTINEYYLWGCVDMPNSWDWYVQQITAQTQYEHFKRAIAVPFDTTAALSATSATSAASIASIASAVVLKSPHHSVKMDTIANVFENPVFVWLHRDVCKVVGSCCSMNLTVIECGTSTYESKHCIGIRTLRTLAKSMEKAVEIRIELETKIAEERRTRKTSRSRSGVQFVDIFDQELRHDPVAAARRVYSTLNMTVSAEFEELINQDTKQRSEAKAKGDVNHSRHHYTLEEFGLTEEMVNVAFAKYLAMVDRIQQQKKTQ